MSKLRQHQDHKNHNCQRKTFKSPSQYRCRRWRFALGFASIEHTICYEQQAKRCGELGKMGTCGGRLIPVKGKYHNGGHQHKECDKVG